MVPRLSEDVEHSPPNYKSAELVPRVLNTRLRVKSGDARRLFQCHIPTLPISRFPKKNSRPRGQGRNMKYRKSTPTKKGYFAPVARCCTEDATGNIYNVLWACRCYGRAPPCRRRICGTLFFQLMTRRTEEDGRKELPASLHPPPIQCRWPICGQREAFQDKTNLEHPDKVKKMGRLLVADPSADRQRN